MKVRSLQQVISNITPADTGAMERARDRWSSIAKPLGSLGLLEDAIIRAAGAMGTDQVGWDKKAVAVFCADNGVVAENVTQTGQTATASVAAAMARGESCVCRMARRAQADVFPVDIGIAGPVHNAEILDRNMMRGTQSIARGPAMTRTDAETAVMIGVHLAKDLSTRGYGLLAAGEMGIGNTTTAAAVSAVLLGAPVEEVTGRGAGLSTDGLAHKIEIIRHAIQINRPEPENPIDIICKVGGLDIAAMTGFYLGAALERVPVILDGAISCAAALAAVRLCPNAVKSMIASHRPAEPCGAYLLDALGLMPFIHAGLRLGEGTGAVAAMPMLDMALAIYQDMASFDQMGLAAYQPQS